MNINTVMLYGNLTRDPEVRAMPGGGQVANISLATNRTFKDKNGQQQEQTEFHSAVAFGRQAEIIGQYFVKGKPIFIEGRLQTRSWEKDGAKHYKTEVVVESFQFGDGGPRTNGASAPAPAPARSASVADEEINPEDIPF